jgi:hypothetical protein
VSDAEFFYKWVIGPLCGGLDPNNVKLIISQNAGGYTPRGSDIENEIMVFYDKLWNTGPKVGRRLYLFMAEHGIAPGDGNDCSLVSSDSWPNAFWVVTGRLTAERVLKQPMFEEVVLFMACCRDVIRNPSD